MARTCLDLSTIPTERILELELSREAREDAEAMGWRKLWERYCCPQPLMVLASSFSSLLFLLPSGLKIKCPVLALIMPFIFIFTRLRLCNLPMTSCDLRHLMCVGGGKGLEPIWRTQNAYVVWELCWLKSVSGLFSQARKTIFKNKQTCILG